MIVDNVLPSYTYICAYGAKFSRSKIFAVILCNKFCENNFRGLRRSSEIYARQKFGTIDFVFGLPINMPN